MNAYAVEMGFKDQTDMLRLLASVPMETIRQKQAYLRWRNKDGTKRGLLKLLRGLDD